MFLTYLLTKNKTVKNTSVLAPCYNRLPLDDNEDYKFSDIDTSVCDTVVHDTGQNMGLSEAQIAREGDNFDNPLLKKKIEPTHCY